MEITGTLKVKGQTIQVSDKFSKRELVVTEDSPTYPQHISMQLTQDRCSLLDGFNVGDKVKVSINIKGREYVDKQGETKYFTSIEAWKIALVSGTTNPVNDAPKRLSDDDLGF